MAGAETAAAMSSAMMTEASFANLADQDGSCGCSLQGCLAFAVFIFVFFFLLPPVYIAFLGWMQDNCNSAFDYSFWIFAALIGMIATAIYFLLRFFKRLYRDLI